MIIIQVILIGIIGAVLAITIKGNSPVMALMITFGASLAIIFITLDQLAEVVVELQMMGARLGDRVNYVGVVLQVLFIAYAAELGAQVCHDAGESAVGHRIELAGKVLIMIAALPIVRHVFSLVEGILS